METIISILILVTSFSDVSDAHKTGVWFEEFAVPHEQFVAEGYEVTIASVKGGVVPIDPGSARDLDAHVDAVNALKNSVKIGEIDVSKFDAIYIPGGHGAMFDLASDAASIKAIEHFAQNGKLVASVCHGPAALVNVKLANGEFFVKGKTMTSFTDAEENKAGKGDSMPFWLETRLRENGANFIVSEPWSDHVEVDDNLITGQNPQSSESVGKAIIKALSKGQK